MPDDEKEKSLDVVDAPSDEMEGAVVSDANEGEDSKLVPPEEVEALRKQIEEAQAWRVEYERGKQEMEEERKRLAAEKEQVADALAFRKALEADPQLARAIQQAAAERLYGRQQEPNEDLGTEAGVVDPRLVQAVQVLAQHGQATEKQLSELQNFVEEQRKHAEEWREYRRQVDMAKFEQSVRAEAERLAAKYEDRYEFAEVDDVVRYALANPDEVKKVGVAGLMRRSHEENKRIVEKHLPRKLEVAQKAKQNTLPTSSTGVASAPKQVLSGKDRFYAMDAFLEKMTAS